MKIMRKPLAMLLVLFMLISMVPINSFAASNAAGTEATVAEAEGSENDFMKVFHLDCGRKSFTVDQVKELIDSLSEVGFSHMELAIGNDGLRLLLDDMSISANGTTYSSETVKEGIKAGNAAYSHSGEWSQAEMDTIISYAATKGIEIIPLVNNPGHMDSILAAMEKCGIDGYYESSKRTVDLENAAAVAFTQALVMKYANYFAGKGCKYFNIGADEYANDYHTSDSTGMGFGYLIDNNKYGIFITYINTLVENICDLGMTPIAFNDGIYFRENTSFGSFDNRLMIASWTGGWGGIKPASTTFLASKGHKILNTNERWYYVLGRSQSVNSTYCYESALSNSKSESVTTVTDHTDVTPIGAMQCVWCDDPSVDYGSYKSNVMTLINTFAENNPTYFTGPNEPLTPESVTMTDEETGISVTAPGLTGLTVAKTTAPSVEGAVTDKILAWDITPVTNNGNYTGEATVSIPVPPDWTNVRGGVYASEHGPEVMGIKGNLENCIFTFTVPHFSNVVAYELDPAAIEADETINLTVGETSQTYTDNTGYYTIAEGLDTSIATATLGGNAGSEATVKYTEADVSCNDLISSNNSSWQKTNYYYTPDSGKNYYPVYAKRSGNNNRTFTWGYSSTDSSNDVTQIGTQTVNRYSVSYTNPNITVYEKSGTEAVPAKTTVSFTGISVGTTYATVGETVYKIVVGKKTESATLTVGDTKTYADKSTSAPVVADSTVADASITNGNLTITAKAKGTTTVTTDNAIYTINVVEFDPSTVTPLTVEYWITNITTRTKESTNESPVISQQISAAANDVATAEGADINKMMPEGTIKKDGDSGADREVEFWHVRLLDKTKENNSTSGTEEQTTDSADDETTNGDAVTRVRYYDPDSTGRRWQLLSGTTWMDVDQDNNQVVAYYMEEIDIQNSNGTTELHVNAADWGKLGDGSPASSYADTSKYCSISLQIVYEDGSGNPATTTAEDLDSKTILYNYWDNGRGIGTFAFDTLGQFNIYQITAETGAVTAEFNGGAWGTAQVTEFTWDNNEKVVWSGESETASVYNNTSNPTNEDPKDNLMWDENQEAILLRVYVKAVETEDSLNVVYIDEKFNDTLYSYNLQVEKDHNFNNSMEGTPTTLDGGRINVTGCGIVNAYGQTQNFQTDLTKVPEAKGKYNSELYTYTGSEISEDGKTLYLYYNINTNVLKPNYVIDFGLPLTFSLKEITNTPDLAKKVTASARYGTVDYDSTNKVFTYTPTTILQNIDVLSINIEFDGEEAVSTTNIGVTPATTVFYEESIIDYDANWNVPDAPTKMQATEVLGESSYYGFDSAYDGVEDGVEKPEIGSNATYAESKATGAAANFTFTGTGFELYANSKPASGFVTVYSQGELSKLYMINTKLTDVNGGEMGENSTYYSLPVISETDLPHGTYTVQIKQTNGEKPIYVDGVRIVNTIDETGKTAAESVYYNDEEDKPVFHEIRDYVLNAVKVENLKESDYISSSDRASLVKAVKDMAGQVYNALGDGNKAVLITDGTTFAEDQAQDLLDNGPKNEVYLYSGQTLAFSVNTNRVMQLGLKAPTGSAKFELTVDGKTLDLNSLSTTVDMFYKLAEKGGTTSHTVSVKVTDGVLSVTDLKVCDDPTATFNDLTQKDIEDVLLGIYGLGEEPETPVVPEEPGTPDEPTQEPEHECAMKEMIQPATTTKNGKVINKCKECGEVESTKIIYKASNVKLGQATFVYNGKAKNPKVIVKDSKGNTIAQKYYTVVKPTGRTNVGKYTYTIKFKGHYQGMKKLTLTVKPKATAIKTVTPSKKAFTVKWNKVSKQATGYEIMYATNAKFSKGKHTVTVKNFKTTSKKISNLKAKQKYYVKVRTYKTVKVNGKMTKIYSNWSKYRTVTTKR